MVPWKCHRQYKRVLCGYSCWFLSCGILLSPLIVDSSQEIILSLFKLGWCENRHANKRYAFDNIFQYSFHPKLHVTRVHSNMKFKWEFFCQKSETTSLATFVPWEKMKVRSLLENQSRKNLNISGVWEMLYLVHDWFKKNNKTATMTN